MSADGSFFFLVKAASERFFTLLFHRVVVQRENIYPLSCFTVYPVRSRAKKMHDLVGFDHSAVDALVRSRARQSCRSCSHLFTSWHLGESILEHEFCDLSVYCLRHSWTRDRARLHTLLCFRGGSCVVLVSAERRAFSARFFSNLLVVEPSSEEGCVEKRLARSEMLSPVLVLRLRSQLVFAVCFVPTCTQRVPRSWRRLRRLWLSLQGLEVLQSVTEDVIEVSFLGDATWEITEREEPDVSSSRGAGRPQA